MNKRILLLLSLLSFCLLAQAAPLSAAAAPRETHLLVKYKTPPAISEMRALGVETTDASSAALQKLGVHRLSLPDEAATVATLERLKADPNVLYAEVNHIRHTCEVVPNDKFFSSQWAIQAIDLSDAWEISRGSADICVAVIDSGVAIDHPQLADRVIGGYDYIRGDTVPEDEFGHGTTVAGVIAASANDGQQTAGIAWDVRLLVYKVLDHEGNGYDDVIAAAIQQAADDGAQVINLSLGGLDTSGTLQVAVDYAHARGCVIVAATGNGYRAPVLYPAACDNVIAVGAQSENQGLASFSNIGRQVDVVAPGVDIAGISRNIWPEDFTPYKVSGTSFAAPYVAGLAALLLSVDPSLSNGAVEALITGGAVDQGDPGRDDLFGYGLINARNSLLALLGQRGWGAVTLNLDRRDNSLLDVRVGGQAVRSAVYQNQLLLSSVPLGYQSITIARPGFLPASLNLVVQPGVNPALAVDLLYGDLNGDGLVDLFDLVKIARNLGQSTAALAADYDLDGNTTLADLAAAAANYGR